MKTEFKCEICGKMFSKAPYRLREMEKKGQKVRFCSTSCRLESLKKGGSSNPSYKEKNSYVCEVCGKIFESYPYSEQKMKSKGFQIRFCSRKCQTIARQTDAGSSVVVCEVCGKSFGPVTAKRKSQDRGKFCSMKCYRISRRGKSVDTHPGIEKVSYICENCGEKFEVNPCEVRHREKYSSVIRFCSRECKLEFWRDFYRLHPSKRKDFSKYQRMEILERDGHRCVRCGCDTLDELQCDHVIPWFLDGKNSVDNGQTLCRSCHKGKTAEDLRALVEQRRK